MQTTKLLKVNLELSFVGTGHSIKIFGNCFFRGLYWDCVLAHISIIDGGKPLQTVNLPEERIIAIY